MYLEGCGCLQERLAVDLHGQRLPGGDVHAAALGQPDRPAEPDLQLTQVPAAIHSHQLQDHKKALKRGTMTSIIWSGRTDPGIMSYCLCMHCTLR